MPNTEKGLNMVPKMKVVQIDGGIGRTICAEPALQKYAEKNKTVVLTPWPDIFEHAEYLEEVIPLDRGYLFNDIIRHGEFIYPEPYYRWQYYTQQEHLIESFDNMLNGKSSGITRPNFYFQPKELKKGNVLVDRIRGESKYVIAFQPFGSGAQFNQQGQFFDNTYRSLSPLIAERIVDLLPECIFLNCSHLEIHHPRVFSYKFGSRELIAVIHACDLVITVDSFLAHAAYACNRQGLEILGSTFAANIGYRKHFLTYTKQGYPASYTSNRIGGCIDRNQDAMSFSEKEIDDVIKMFRNKFLSKKRCGDL